MALSDGLERDLASIRLPRWGRVVAAEGVVPWLVVDTDGEVVEPIQRFLRDFVARGNRIGSWTPTGFVDTIRSGTMVYEERTGSGTGSQEVHPGI